MGVSSSTSDSTSESSGTLIVFPIVVSSMTVTSGDEDGAENVRPVWLVSKLNTGGRKVSSEC